ncbi:RNA polymerase subunit sigma-24 [Hymenobacter lapidarius]|uniref:RNA polymerase subunit sigma-24 n=1 Tax=Hymenobacter lapidarius TaxID=1908237 RepID=A0A1G1T3E5_9BACT|nr:sigma-70 family RNA polymerase sigma factor [Hymenobacter lapidarius]OGX85397.1 RNA polymerase subunit sigma-24 [Hymenobacter lapidarius]
MLSVAPIVEAEIERGFSLKAQRDFVLIQAALDGSAKAYDALLRSYHKSVYHIALRMVRDPDDADDLTMEVFAKAFRYLSRYRPQFAFSTWLFRIATNSCIDFVRRKKLKTQSLNAAVRLGDGESILLDLPDHAPNPQEAFIRQQRLEAVQRVVTQLPANYARLVRLRYFEELSYEEVATELQVPLGTVKAQLFRARELLLHLLQASKAAI